MLQWLFRKKPENPSVQEQLDLFGDELRALSRGLKGVKTDLEELDESITRRFGKLFGRLKASQNNEDPGEGAEVPAAAVRSPMGDAELLQTMRRRRAILPR